MPALEAFFNDLLSVVEREFVLPEDHRSCEIAVLAADRKNLSFVDLTSFQTMRRLGIKNAFSFDKHFWEQGFNPATPTHLKQIGNL